MTMMKNVDGSGDIVANNFWRMMMVMMMAINYDDDDVGYGGDGSTPTTDMSRLYTIFLMFAGKYRYIYALIMLCSKPSSDC